jgi:hypothetical protein
MAAAGKGPEPPRLAFSRSPLSSLTVLPDNAFRASLPSRPEGPAPRRAEDPSLRNWPMSEQHRPPPAEPADYFRNLGILSRSVRSRRRERRGVPGSSRSALMPSANCAKDG